MNHLDIVRVRFAPTPTGTPHVVLIRAALFTGPSPVTTAGWCPASKTPTARDSEESHRSLLDALRWLGLDWGEGPEVGGTLRAVPAERAGRDVLRRRPPFARGGRSLRVVLHSRGGRGRAPDGGAGTKLGYDNADRDTTAAQAAAFSAEGRVPVLRLRMPDEDLSWTDPVRGKITFRAGAVPAPVLVRGNGQPLYTLTNPVDDALMRITHVLRGADLLPSTPRQLGLYAALVRIGVTAATPAFGHSPSVTGEGNRKLSKRDPWSVAGSLRLRRVPAGRGNLGDPAAERAPRAAHPACWKSSVGTNGEPSGSRHARSTNIAPWCWFGSG